MKLQLISLDGLLDYNLDDIMEKTFEVSLFAELFYEMLQHRSAIVIAEALRDSQRQAESEEAAIRQAALAAGGKRKADDAQAKDAKKIKAEGQVTPALVNFPTAFM